MEVITNDGIQTLQEKAGAKLSSLLTKEGTAPLLLLLSGGSALTILEHVEIPADSSHITLGVLDERFIKNPRENNCALLKETGFYKKMIASGAQSINTTSPSGSVEILAESMEKAWRAWMQKNPHGKVIATFGMGPDGHTSGIMPYAEDPGMFEILFEDERRFVVGYDARGKNPIPFRATATIPFIRSHVSTAIGYITGSEKQAGFDRLLAPTGTYAETPVRVFKDVPQVHLFTTLSQHTSS